jgi:hypothetical protein
MESDMVCTVCSNERTDGLYGNAVVEVLVFERLIGSGGKCETVCGGQPSFVGSTPTLQRALRDTELDHLTFE